MAIPREKTNTGEVLKDSRFHRASIKADPDTAHLAPRVEAAENDVRAKRAAAEAAEDVRIELYAKLLRADFALDALTRTVELEVLAAVNKDRRSDAYRGCLPRGLSDLLATRGEEQARETRALVDGLHKWLPAIGERHGVSLLELATGAGAAETAWLEAERAAATADGEERIARTHLIRTLQRNEGALAELFPGNKRRVRSYFRPTRRRSAAEPGGGDTDPTV